MSQGARGLLAVVICAGCIEGSTNRPVGERCTGDGECADGLLCLYGRCRVECLVDRDCPAGQACIADEGDSELRACTLPAEAGCVSGDDCPGATICDDGVCRNECAEPEDCGLERTCDDGVCVDGDAPTPPIDLRYLAAGSSYTMAATRSLEVFGWGANDSGQLALPPSGAVPSPVSLPLLTGGAPVLGGSHGCAVEDGVVRCWGRNRLGQLGVDHATTPETHLPVEVSLPRAQVGVAAGSTHSCSWDSESFSCWGEGENGRLGDGEVASTIREPQTTPLLGISSMGLGLSHSCAITEGGDVYCWGVNGAYQVGVGSSGDVPVPTPVAGVSEAMGLAVGGTHGCVWTRPGETICWGSNIYGELGRGGTSAGELAGTIPSFGNVTGLSAGIWHTCALTTSGEVYCWGGNSDGQLGTSDLEERHEPTPVAGLSDVAVVSCGWFHTCALTTSGEVYCWGANGFGEVGDGTSDRRTAPTLVVF